MASIDLSGYNINQLNELVDNSQAAMASRERRPRKDLRSELERRLPEWMQAILGERGIDMAAFRGIPMYWTSEQNANFRLRIRLEVPVSSRTWLLRISS